jgi:hypothetical protein
MDVGTPRRARQAMLHVVKMTTPTTSQTAKEMTIQTAMAFLCE